MPEPSPALDLVVIGAGITGLTTAYLSRAARPDLRFAVLEREPSPGGKARTTVRDGYIVDRGPNGFVANAPATLELVRSLDLQGDLRPASPAAARRYLYHDGGLRPFPTSPTAFLGTEVLGVGGKVRALLELAVGSRHEGEESVYDFLRRHFGRGLADAFARPLVAGITAGDPRALSVDALFPRMRAMERQHGSLLRAFLSAEVEAGKRKREASRAAGPSHEATAKDAASTPTRGRLTSFSDGGIQRLTDALHAALGAAVRTDARVSRLELPERGPAGRPADPRTQPYRVHLHSGEVLRAAQVALCTPAHVAAELLASELPTAAEALRSIPYVGMRVFGLGFDRVDVPRVLDGFGFLPAPDQGIRSLGVLWSSVLFPDHAPPGKVLLRVLAGGALDPDMLDLDADAALVAVRRDLELALGIVAEPEFVEALRLPQAIPQYTIGHAARLRAINEATEPYAGLHLAGNAYRGVGLNDCVRDARETAEKVCAAIPVGAASGPSADAVPSARP